MSCCGKSKYKRIVEGWKNVFWPDPLIEEIALRRADMCDECNEKKWIGGLAVCLDCGCPIMAKCRSLSEECGLGKWKSENVTTHV